MRTKAGATGWTERRLTRSAWLFFQPLRIGRVPPATRQCSLVNESILKNPQPVL
jgi:hypothetical protein